MSSSTFSQADRVIFNGFFYSFKSPACNVTPTFTHFIAQVFMLFIPFFLDLDFSFVYCFLNQFLPLHKVPFILITI